MGRGAPEIPLHILEIILGSTASCCQHPHPYADDAAAAAAAAGMWLVSAHASVLHARRECVCLVLCSAGLLYVCMCVCMCVYM